MRPSHSAVWGLFQDHPLAQTTGPIPLPNTRPLTTHWIFFWRMQMKWQVIPSKWTKADSATSLGHQRALLLCKLRAGETWDAAPVLLRGRGPSSC